MFSPNISNLSSKSFLNIPKYLFLPLNFSIKKNYNPNSFIEERDEEKGFSSHYRGHISPLVEEIEDKRIETLKKIRTRICYFYLLLPILAGLFFVLSRYLDFSKEGTVDMMDILGIKFLVVIGVFSWAVNPAKKFNTELKESIFNKILSFFEDITYKSDGSGIVQYDKFKILPDYDTYKSEDLIKGKYKDVEIEAQEVELIEIKRGSKGREKRVTVFKGLNIMLSVHKNFKGRTIIKNDFGKVGNLFSSGITKFGNDLENVKLEDPEFEKIFEVYSNDQIEARYLLTTSFMQRLLDLTKTFHSNQVQASFYEESLFITIPYTADLFATPSIFQSTNFVKESKIIIKEVNLIFEIINILKLNQNIGL